MRTDHARTRTRDRTADLLRDGYTFADGVRARAGSPEARAVPLKLLGRPAVLVRGTDAVRFFYDSSLLRRAGALPAALKVPLFGRGAVHGLDDAEHRHRKRLFLEATTPDRVAELVAAVDREWARALPAAGSVDVYESAVRVYGRAVMAWAGLGLSTDEIDDRAARQALVIDVLGAGGPSWLRAVQLRRDNDAWARRLIARTRLEAVPGGRAAGDLSVLELVARHRDAHGELLDGDTAAVELQNLLRPTIAVSRYAAFAALALHEHPEWVARLRAEVSRRGTAVGGPEATAFAHEVRRVHPFVPLIPARARRDLSWGGLRIEKGQRVLLDVPGTNTDPAEWPRAREFDPGRFLGVDAAAVENFVPQGGGCPREGHRCPGEDVTVGLLAVTAARLAARDWTADPGTLAYDLHRMPTRPQGGPVLHLAR